MIETTLRVAAPAGFPLQLDGLGIVMLVLVVGLSVVIQAFATRYLRGDARRWWFVATASALTVTTGLMVCAASVLAFAIAWVAAGISLVLLLGTYPQLAQARDGMWRTAIGFAIGDAGLTIAVVALLVTAGGDIRLGDVGVTLSRMPEPLATATALLLVLPALARSAQVPFHRWLPATLAAPTPVSALMHAGVVNAGAILLIRFSPAVGSVSLAMALVFTAGAVTLAYASLVRLVKPDAKGRLVFSTMAQMGFMMLACGLGAFAAAVFHLVAHGMFKSALFLSASSGIARQADQRRLPVRARPRPVVIAASVLLGFGIPIGALVLARAIIAPDVSAASVGLLAFVVLTTGVALTAGLAVRFTPATIALGVVGVAALAFGYAAMVRAFELTLALGPTVSAAISPWWLVVPGLVLLGIELLTRNRTTLPPLTRMLYARVLASGSPPPTRHSPSRAAISAGRTALVTGAGA